MSTQDNGIVLKGNAEGLVIVIPENYTFDMVVTELESRISSAGRFFQGATLKVVYRGKKLDDIEENKIEGLIKESSGASIESFGWDEREVLVAANDNGHTAIKKIMFFSGIDEGACKFVKRTLRGGTYIEFDGNVVVLGDVNPGAEIVATGNVVVMGTVRGLIHAGSDGNREAVICAMKLKPTQLRIADCIARCPDDDDTMSIAEIAFIRDGNIYVEPVH